MVARSGRLLVCAVPYLFDTDNGPGSKQSYSFDCHMLNLCVQRHAETEKPRREHSHRTTSHVNLDIKANAQAQNPMNGVPETVPEYCVNV
jgi:hypothetical protein